jgi:AraC-like DNA-binding protein
MTTKSFNFKWQQRIDAISCEGHRIGTDILLIEDANAIRADKYIGHNPFKADMSMAIIYEKGEANFMINMQEYHIKAPAVLIIMLDQTCKLISYSDDLQGRAIVMSDSFTNSLFSKGEDNQVNKLYLSILNNPIVCFDNETNIFGQYYELLFNLACAPNTDYKLDAAKHLTLAMFYGYSHIKHNFSNEKIKTSRRDEIYARFINLLRDNYMHAREVNFYAEKLCITPKHLTLVIKEKSGKTALDIIEEYVITECKALLLSTNKSIQQISDTLNFPSQSVFGKYFKRNTGMSPKEYRNLSENGFVIKD